MKAKLKVHCLDCKLILLEKEIDIHLQFGFTWNTVKCINCESRNNIVYIKPIREGD